MRRAKCSQEGCTESALAGCPEGKCLYHSPTNDSLVDLRSELWREARRQAECPEGCDFTDWHFPGDPDEVYFRGKAFSGEAVFCRATFVSRVDFTKVEFGTGGAIFNEARFLGCAEFSEATFAGEGDFGHAVFEREVRFCNTVFTRRLDFDEAHFHGEANFWGARFGGKVQFLGASFEGKIDFGEASFEDMADFSTAGVRPGEEVWFSLPKLSLRRRGPFRKAEHGKTAFRLARQAAQSRGDQAMAGEYYLAERRAAEIGQRKVYWWRVWRPICFLRCWTEFLLARIVWAYGERPSRLLLAGAGIILVWACLCFAMGGLQPSPGEDSATPGLAQYLYFSVVTFTTLGYGDFYPKPCFQTWAGVEAILGAFLMALFVASLARKHMR